MGLSPEKLAKNRDYKKRNQEKVRAQRRLYNARVYDPEKEREKRRERREYFREYKKIYYSRKENRDRKNACNRKYKYQKRYGELWESAMLVNDIKKEIQDGANGEITEGGVVENPEGTKGESGGPLCSGGDCRAGKGNSKDN